jgi:hypothetical protein
MNVESDATVDCETPAIFIRRDEGERWSFSRHVTESEPERALKVPKVSAHPSQALLEDDGDGKLEVECAVDKSESLTGAGALTFLVASTERLRMFRPLRPSSASEARVEGSAYRAEVFPSYI